MQVRTSPVLVVHVLAYEGVGLHRAVRVHLRHVHVVYEVDECPAARGAVVAAGFLLQRFFQYRYMEDKPRSREQGSKKKSKQNKQTKTLRVSTSEEELNLHSSCEK